MNKDHLAKLEEGVEAWNAWRAEEVITEVNLEGANLEGANLGYANLQNANLQDAFLYTASLPGALIHNANLLTTNLLDSNLRRAVLKDANLQGAILEGANLRGAILVGANLQRAWLDRANLWGATLEGANLHGSKLRGANLTGAIFGDTVFGNTCLSNTIGLDTCRHSGPSIIDHRTLEISGQLPQNFLQGCGLPDLLIDYLPTLLNQPIQFYSCFISYSHADKEFARRLHDQLQGKGIRCWLDEHQMLPGDDIYEQVNRGIKLWDKVLLCCSESSLTSWWVDKEINTTFQKEQKLMKERKEKVLSLIPLNLDGHLFQWENGKADEVRIRMAADFTGWEKDNDKFEAAFELLVKALTTENRGREPAPKSAL